MRGMQKAVADVTTRYEWNSSALSFLLLQEWIAYSVEIQFLYGLKSEALCSWNVVESNLASVTCDCLAPDAPKGPPAYLLSLSLPHFLSLTPSLLSHSLSPLPLIRRIVLSPLQLHDERWEGRVDGVHGRVPRRSHGSQGPVGVHHVQRIVCGIWLCVCEHLHHVPSKRVRRCVCGREGRPADVSSTHHRAGLLLPITHPHSRFGGRTKSE